MNTNSSGNSQQTLRFPTDICSITLLTSLFPLKHFCMFLLLTKKSMEWCRRLLIFTYTLARFSSKRNAPNYCPITSDLWRVLLIVKTFLSIYLEKTTRTLDSSASFAMSLLDVASNLSMMKLSVTLKSIRSGSTTSNSSLRKVWPLILKTKRLFSDFWDSSLKHLEKETWSPSMITLIKWRMDKKRFTS